jgi:hypothetical protein
MANSIRTPKQGVTASSRRIAEAVDDEEWQKFRLSLKGRSTQNKLHLLNEYLYEYNGEDEDVLIRVDNYLKALARGGQIEAVRFGDYLHRLSQGTLVIKK